MVSLGSCYGQAAAFGVSDISLRYPLLFRTYLRISNSPIDWSRAQQPRKEALTHEIASRTRGSPVRTPAAISWGPYAMGWPTTVRPGRGVTNDARRVPGFSSQHRCGFETPCNGSVVTVSSHTTSCACVRVRVCVCCACVRVCVSQCVCHPLSLARPLCRGHSGGLSPTDCATFQQHRFVN